MLCGGSHDTGVGDGGGSVVYISCPIWFNEEDRVYSALHGGGGVREGQCVLVKR